MNKLLPIGSIVLLKESNKKIMIYGRLQKSFQSGKLYDYIACCYPEGNIDPNKSILFNHEDIECVYFIGFQDKEEIEYGKLVDEKYNELKGR